MDHANFVARLLVATITGVGNVIFVFMAIVLRCQMILMTRAMSTPWLQQRTSP